MKYAWLTAIIDNQSMVAHDTLMILPFEDGVVETLQGVAQATHYAGKNREWWHKELVWMDNSAYNATDKFYSEALYQIRFVYTPDDSELKSMSNYLGVKP